MSALRASLAALFLMATAASAAEPRTSILATDNRRDLLIEGVAATPDGRWLVSAVAGRTIFRIEAGRLVPFLRGDSGTGALFGLAVDAPRGVVWAAEAWGAGLPGGTGDKRTALLKVSLADGRILARHPAPGATTFGDVVVDPAGAVYASDSATGAVWVLAPGDAAPRRVSHPKGATSAQGMALCPLDVMVASDYATGLHRIELGDGSSTPVTGGPKVAGLDALVVTSRRDRVEVLATYNGDAPHRLLRLTLSADCRRLEKVETLVRGGPLTDVALAAIGAGGVAIVAHSQWSGWTADGARNAADPSAAQVIEVEIP
ncbi:MAG: hypothetical protein AB1942_10440 [Pseudomonadota bacterium]